MKQLNKFNEQSIKVYEKNTKIKKNVGQYNDEKIDVDQHGEELKAAYANLKYIKMAVIAYVIATILGVILTFAEIYVDNHLQDIEEKKELLGKELLLETSFAQNIEKSMIVENELVYKNGVTMPLANKYITTRVNSFSVGEECIKNNISNFTRVIKTSYENKKYYDKSELEDILAEFGDKLVKLEGYVEKEVIGEEGKVYFRNEKNECFTYIIINGYDVIYGIAKNVEF